MLIVAIILIFMLAISLYSEIHAIGSWFVLLMTHGFLYQSLGSIAEHMPMIAGLIIVATIVARNRWRPVPAKVLLAVTLLCLIMSAAALAGVDPKGSLPSLVGYWKGFVLALVIAGTIKSNAQIKLLTIYCLAGATFGVFVTLYEYFTGAYGHQGYEFSRAALLYGGPNVSCALLLTGLPLAVYWAAHARRKSVAIVCFTLIGLIIAGVALTQSRSGFITLMAILFFIYLKKPSIKALVLGLAVLGVGIAFVSVDQYTERIGSVAAEENERGRAMDLRIHFVKAGIKMFIANPALGIGAGNFGKVMMLVDPAPGSDASINWVAHNMYLEFFVENGLFGGLLFVVFFAAIIRQVLRFDKLNKSENSVYGLGYCVAMSLFAILMSGLFLSIGKLSVLWFLTGLGMAVAFVTKSLDETSSYRGNQ